MALVVGVHEVLLPPSIGKCRMKRSGSVSTPPCIADWRSAAPWTPAAASHTAPASGGFATPPRCAPPAAQHKRVMLLYGTCKFEGTT